MNVGSALNHKNSHEIKI